MERWFTEPFRKNHPETVKQIAAPYRQHPGRGLRRLLRRRSSKLNITARLKEHQDAGAGHHRRARRGAPPRWHARYIGENIPGAKLVLIPQAAHIANIEQPEAFNRALRGFLSSPASG